MHNLSHGLPRTCSRGFVSLGLILLLVIAAGIIGGGAYYAGSQRPAAQQVPTGSGATSTAQQQQPGIASKPADGFANLCAAYVHLKRGDTDATTDGQVTQLQQFLGILPTTGTYGALTGIGYTNKCVGGNASPASVPGMSKYTDADFGFSFWYPSGWITTNTPNDSDSSYIQIKEQVGKYPRTISIYKAYRSNGLFDASGACGTCQIVKYYFDSVKAAWMQTVDPVGNGGTTSQADVSNNTMGGLHIFPDSSRFGGSVVPLSATKFLRISGDDGGLTRNLDKAFTKTIVATDPTVAIPVSTAEQTATIEAEAAAYGDTVQSAVFDAFPLSGYAPLEVTFSPISTTYAQGGVDFGDNSSSSLNGYCTGTNCSIRHTYTMPGTYKAHLLLHTNGARGADTVIATLIITVQ
jgi:hypothetical protein